MKYQETQMGVLVERVGDAIDRFRAGELDAFVDQVPLPVLACGEGIVEVLQPDDPELAASIMHERPVIDWWERGARRER